MKTNKAFIELNLALIFLSTSGVLGRLIDMAPTLIIWWRCAFAVIIMYGFVKINSLDLKVHHKGDYFTIILSAILLAAHWVSYFYSLALSNIAIAMLTLHTFPAMTALLEPVILKTKFKLYHLLLAFMIVLGVYIMLPPEGQSEKIIPAIIFGLVSALAYALRNIYTRKIIARYNGSSMMFFQLVIMTIILLPILFTESTTSIKTEWPFVASLALITTCLGHTLFVRNLKTYNATTISLLSSIVPIYGILWGIIFLSEYPSTRTIIGGTIILVAFIIESKKGRVNPKT